MVVAAGSRSPACCLPLGCPDVDNASVSLMITYVDGYLLQAPAQTLVNTVNTVGVMGKGIAKDFKAAFPDMYSEYRRLCELGRLRIGTLWLYKSPHKWVLNFPTKEDWRRPSKPEYVEKGLQKFVESYQLQGITSIAFPALGCGNGGLDWETQVRPLMERHLGELPISIFLYPHRQRTTLPEHETPEAIATWLRSRPESLSFHEFWADIKNLLAQPRRFESSDARDYELALQENGVEIRDGESALVDLDEMLDLWQQLRRHGFASDALIPVNLETRIQYLLPLLAELPYVRTVRVGRNYAELTGKCSHGLQYLPRVDKSRTPAPRAQPLTPDAGHRHTPQRALPL